MAGVSPQHEMRVMNHHEKSVAMLARPAKAWCPGVTSGQKDIIFPPSFVSCQFDLKTTVTLFFCLPSLGLRKLLAGTDLLLFSTLSRIYSSVCQSSNSENKRDTFFEKQLILLTICVFSKTVTFFFNVK